MLALRRNTVIRVAMAVTAIVAWLALLLQFPLTLATSRANGMGTAGAIITYFSFFTILTNLLVALVLSFSLWAPSSSLGSFSSRPIVTSGAAVYIAVVGAAYSLLLRNLWNPEGLQKVADVLLHDIVPVMYIACWLIFMPKGVLRWKSVLLWLIYPLVYLSCVLARGALSGRYPYPFIDVGTLGYPRVFSNAEMLVGAFLGIGLLVVRVSRWMGRMPRGTRL